MRVKKVIVTFVLSLIALILGGVLNVSNAATGSKYLGIQPLRSTGYGYQAFDKNIWKIVEYEANQTTYDYDSTIYCLRAGPGFGSEIFGSGTPAIRHYTEYFNMKDPDSIVSPYDVAIPEPGSETYNSLLWLLENVYVAPSSTPVGNEAQDAAEFKSQLLAAAGIQENLLTDDDIDAVQQLAVWHFTNMGDGNYDAGTNGNFDLHVTVDPGYDRNYMSLSDNTYFTNGWNRAIAAQKLYRYLVQTATSMGATYKPSTASQPYEIAETQVSVAQDGNNYVIGPYRIEQISQTTGILEGVFQNGNGETLSPTLQDESGKRFNSLEETIGKNFFIVLPDTTNIERLIFTINGSYFETTIQYWSVENAPGEDQPVAIIDREKKDYTDSKEITYEEEKIYDLALRKFITSINNVPVEPSREPQISSDTLADLRDGRTTTAEKIHPKNPLTVQTGDTVVYTIRVYNEGEEDAIVREVTDYLPDGLEFKEDSDINRDNGWMGIPLRYARLENAYITYALNGQVIPGFDGTKLSYLDLQIECVVTAEAGKSDTKLKNIAEITEITDTEGEPVEDRDSTPENVRDLENYGEESQEDDDDFEDLILPKKSFDLSLRKFITAVNDTELKDAEGNYLRAPQVDVTALASGAATTATYNHTKETLGVEVGDEVIYTIRVYNEGELNGYVTEIRDYLPTNLEFVNDSFNQERGWVLDADGRTVTTDLTSPDSQHAAARDAIYANRKTGTDKVLLDAFNGTTLDYIDVQIKCKVKDTALPGEKLTNIADITGHIDEDKNQVIDIDSQPGNVTYPNDSTLPNYRDDEINRGDKYIPGQQDDDDFEKVVVEEFDLALRKYITSITSGDQTTEYDRVPRITQQQIDGLLNGSINTAEKTHTKEPIQVKTGDRVLYTIMIYNEGSVDGYASEITDFLPDGLRFVEDSEINKQYGWTNPSGDKETYITTALADDIIYKVENVDGTAQLRAQFVQIECEVVAEIGERETSLKNVAEITEAKDGEGNERQDRDSTPDNLDWEQKYDYNPGESERGWGYEDDDDYEELYLPEATGDFEIKIVKVNGLGNGLPDVTFEIVEAAPHLIDSRDLGYEPTEFTTDENGEILTGRQYCESYKEFYIREVNVPEGYEKLPETIDLIIHFNIVDGKYVAEPEIGNEDPTLGGRILKLEVQENNTIVITIENSYFDLALRKFVTTINGNPVATNGTPAVDRTPQISDETKQNLFNRNTTTAEKTHTKEPLQVKTGDRVVYTIRVYNEGEKAGHAAEITDYLPEGLRFVEDSDINKQNGWTNPNGDGRTVVTTALADDLINAFDGTTLDYKDVQIECEVVAEYGDSNISLKNIAEITKATNEEGNDAKDRDSTPKDLTDEQKNNYNPGESERGWGYEDDDDYEELVLPAPTGDFELKLIKVNGLGNRLSGATFKVEELNSNGDVVNTYDNLTTNEAGEVVTDRINISGVGTYTFVITENAAPDGYELLAEPIRLEVKIEIVDGVYTVTEAKAVRAEEDVSQSNLQGQNFNAAEMLATTISLETDNLNVNEDAQTVSIANGAVKSVEVNGNTVEITIENSYFDLALRKFITTINGNPVATHGTPAVDRTPQISDETKQNLFNRNTTTAEKTHTKEPLQVNTGDSVVYTIRVYNEGEIAGHAAEITDYLPEGLRFVEDSEINAQYGWTNPNGDGRTVVTTALADDLINAFDGTTLDYKDVQIECEVVAIKGQTEQKLKNVAEITKATDEKGNDEKDRDSTPENLTEEQKENYNPGESEKGWGYEDDDDYEELVLPAATGDFKIKLIKQNGLGNRLQDAVFKVEEVNTEGTVINTFDDLKTNENGEILIDNFNIEQEGDRTFVITEKEAPKGYEVLPEPITIQVQIRLVNGEYVITANAVSGDGAKKQQETSTEENVGEQNETTDTAKVSNRNVELAKTEQENSSEAAQEGYILNNVAENAKRTIRERTEGEREIASNNVIEPNTLKLASTDSVRSLKLSSKKFSNNEQINTTSNGIKLAANTNSGEDVNASASEASSRASGGVADVRVNGDTIEVVIENNAFDLSLRKFITGVNDEEITNRVPVFSIKDGEYVYTHTKDPVEVANGDIVIYTLRVYNEGTLAGYAEEVKDDLPEGLEFLPDNSVNTEYRWVMYDANGEVTENVADAVSIRTDYLSKAQADETGRDNLLAAFNQDTMSQPDYRDLQIAFRVTEPNTSDRVLINTAEISEDTDENGDPVVDIDSTPDNDNEDEDDIDIEKVKVTYFDLALRKIISKVTMTLDGKTTVEETGHKFEDDPEEVVKIELGNHKIEDSVLKFTYQIRITNEGNKAGYAYEIKDYIPEGLRFVEEDNEGWVLSEDGKTVTTDQLKDVLLEPGDSRVVEITLRWINGQTNLGVKQNWAEISEDSDDDIDSTPDNKVEGEDDIDEASVVLSIVTGIGENYALVIGTVLVITAGGIFLIKRFVL